MLIQTMKLMSSLKNNVLINDFKINTDKESDLEYSARANGLIQNFGFNNIEKIKIILWV